MEYASGGELFDYIVSNTRLKEKEAARFYQQLLNGIEYIHKLGIVHRDLKPENLLLDHNKNIKIVDFGLSNTYRTAQLLKTACGSPCYAAPEMIAGKKYQGLRVDIWSSGVILFAMVCGYLPFEDPNTSQLYKKILAGDYSLPKFLSGEVKELLRNVLNTDPEKRFSISQIRGHSWMSQIKPELCPGILVGYDSIKVDPNIMEKMSQLGYKNENVRKDVENNHHNGTTTTYYLILKKHIQNGGTSVFGYPNKQEETHLPQKPVFTFRKTISQNLRHFDENCDTFTRSTFRRRKHRENANFRMSQPPPRVEARVATAIHSYRPAFPSFKFSPQRHSPILNNTFKARHKHVSTKHKDTDRKGPTPKPHANRFHPRIVLDENSEFSARNNNTFDRIYFK